MLSGVSGSHGWLHHDVRHYTNKANITDDALTFEDNRADKMKFYSLAACALNLAFKEG